MSADGEASKEESRELYFTTAKEQKVMTRQRFVPGDNSRAASPLVLPTGSEKSSCVSDALQVRFGSKAAFSARKGDVRFTPINDVHRSVQLVCLCHERRSLSLLCEVNRALTHCYLLGSSVSSAVPRGWAARQRGARHD
jgi:hypothetical protein